MKVKQIQFLKNYVKNNYNIGKTCDSINITRSTYRSWMDSHAEFKQAFNDFKDRVLDVVEEGLLEHAKNGNFKVQMFLAKTLMKNRGYVEKQVIEHEGQAFNNVTFEILTSANENTIKTNEETKPSMEDNSEQTD